MANFCMLGYSDQSIFPGVNIRGNFSRRQINGKYLKSLLNKGLKIFMGEGFKLFAFNGLEFHL